MIDKVFKAERLWTLDKLAESLGVRRSWVYNQTYRKLIPHRRISGKLRFDPFEIDAWIETQPGWSLKSAGRLTNRRRE